MIAIFVVLFGCWTFVQASRESSRTLGSTSRLDHHVLEELSESLEAKA